MADFRASLAKMARFGVPRITLALTEKYVRGKLKLKKGQPVLWNGIPLNCIGSERWRKEQAAKAAMAQRIEQQKAARASEDRQFGQPHHGHDESADQPTPNDP
jgi:hypothetical protein